MHHFYVFFFIFRWGVGGGGFEMEFKITFIHFTIVFHNTCTRVILKKNPE